MNNAEARDLAMKIVDRIANHRKVSASAILGDSHKPHIVSARHLACYQLRREGFTLPQIGRLMQRHPSTVLYAVRKLQAGVGY